MTTLTGPDGDHDSSPPRRMVVVLLDSLNRHMLGGYGASEFDTPNLDRLAQSVNALRPPLRRLAAVHARPPRPALRCARLPVEAVGLDRVVGGADHRAAARRRRGDQARHGPSAPVRARRRELPLRFHRVGLPARPRRRPVAHPPGPVMGGCAVVRTGLDTVRLELAAGSGTKRTSPALGRWPRPLDGSTKRRPPTTASSCWSTSSIRTSRSTRPSRGPPGMTSRGTGRTSSGRRTPTAPSARAC